MWRKGKMLVSLSALICLSVVQLCAGDQAVEEAIARKRPRLGGWVERNPESPEIQAAADFAEKLFNANSKGKKMFKLVSINSAKFQVTNQINYRVDAVMGKTKCLKSENHDLKSCTLVQKRLNCVFDVSSHPSSSGHKLDHQKCQKIVIKE